MKRILFLCTQNACRSQMAEGIANAILGDEVKCFSAGTDPHPINPLAIRTLWEQGMDISRAYSKHVDEFTNTHFDIVVTLCADAKENCPSWPRPAKKIHFGMNDPAKAQGTEEERLQAFRQARQEIMEKLIPILQKELGL